MLLILHAELCCDPPSVCLDPHRAAGGLADSCVSSCVSSSAQSVISEEKGQCYRVLGSGQGPSSCSLPILRNITKQICCCSRVGKAWGSDCQRCPYFGSGWLPCKPDTNCVTSDFSCRHQLRVDCCCSGFMTQQKNFHIRSETWRNVLSSSGSGRVFKQLFEEEKTASQKSNLFEIKLVFLSILSEH